METLAVPKRIERLLEAGYDGFEGTLAEVEEARLTGFETPAVTMLFVDDVATLRGDLHAAGEVRAEAVNVHAGRDWWDRNTGLRFFEQALAEVARSGLAVSFETHRGRLLFEPQSCAAYLRAFTDLRITADFSHWTCVCESLLGDQEDAVALAIGRTAYVHARVGHEEGPQVPDPRTATWLPYVERFEGWWDAIKAAHERRGDAVMRVNPEFGPPNYLWTDPQDGDREVVDVFEVCAWMKARLAGRWPRPASGIPI